MISRHFSLSSEINNLEKGGFRVIVLSSNLQSVREREKNFLLSLEKVSISKSLKLRSWVVNNKFDKKAIRSAKKCLWVRYCLSKLISAKRE